MKFIYNLQQYVLDFYEFYKYVNIQRLFDLTIYINLSGRDLEIDYFQMDGENVQQYCTYKYNDDNTTNSIFFLFRRHCTQ